MQACFIGHRNINKSTELILSLKQTIIELIDMGVTTFLFGSMSEFDALSLKIVTELKERFPFIKRVYVRSNHQHIDDEYEKYLLTYYEQTYFPNKLEKAGKYSYVERNYEMIDQSSCCVFYYDKNYVPQSFRQSKHSAPLSIKRNSGTKIAYNYALKKNKKIINLYK